MGCLMFSGGAMLALLHSIAAWTFCDKCLPDTDITQPGVGLDLTLTYG